LGHNVSVAVPRQPGFEREGLLLARRLTPLPLLEGGDVPVLDGQLPSGVQITAFDAPVLFDRPGVYGDGEHDYADNAARFSLLSQAAAALVSQREQQGKAFDVVHLHDVPAALVPTFLSRMSGPTVPTVLTIHDGSRQGIVAPDAVGALASLAADGSLSLGDQLCLLKAGVVHADALTTVYNPATDPALPSRYDAEDAEPKGVCKTAVLRSLELELELERPLLLAPVALDPQKGSDLVIGALPLLSRNDQTLIVAGRLPAALAKKLRALGTRYRERLAWVEELDGATLRRLYAAADLVLLPSRSEPCGTAQLVAQRYGAAPVARAVGGLADTIVDADLELETGTGFLFDEDSPEALAAATARALGAWGTSAWARLRRRIMRLDLGWDRPARRYLQIYRQTLAARG
jgi:starch synthase